MFTNEPEYTEGTIKTIRENSCLFVTFVVKGFDRD